MRKEYNKLVRDGIPELIRQDNHEYEVVVMGEEEYREALRQKLVEEAGEVAAADHQRLVSELADLYEVIDAVMAAYGIERELVLVEQVRRRVDRGGFLKRLKLLWTRG
ncbi:MULTISPECIES: nucleoside triphosphate pyrophosphohydrolase [unclassified Coleofasciculus]|uniref:nucleoside triphosphate pyrophosphohydrolase n=1 Tax=unclassified Coleofasciculus TaxID=2692782 RepID=UPI00187FC7CD|nr:MULTISPECIES: nucleoside triphosphate pyrophosphohydrolase [unclassified Coleofasciculus]MBE9126215.1 nucleoside triphosphate pyrophosphohydrolase [Coleofasciculus sp. LEGE 07081]MBE9148123.1 nucleoside triphosphate pyrophosphohydrolase [Coleofasciculus sp. LEGE 07092]